MYWTSKAERMIGSQQKLPVNRSPANDCDREMSRREWCPLAKGSSGQATEHLAMEVQAIKLAGRI